MSDADELRSQMKLWGCFFRLAEDEVQGLDCEALADLIPDATTVYGPSGGHFYFLFTEEE